MDYDSEPYTPEIVGKHTESYAAPYEYATLLIRIHACGICGQRMFPNLTVAVLSDLDPRGASEIRTQWQRAGWVLGHRYNLCQACYTAGKELAVCALCKIERPTNQMAQRIGDPPDYLCSVCYESVPARTWDKVASELVQKHRYGYE